MYAGTLPPASNREDWEINITVEDEDTGDAIDLSGADIVLEARDSCGTIVLSATTDNEKVAIVDTGTFTASFTAEEMSCLCAQTLDVGCTLTINGGTRQLIIGRQPVLDGVVSR